MPKTSHSIKEDLLNLIYPRNCVLCNLRGVNLCEKCTITKLEKVDQACHICHRKVHKRSLFVHTDCQQYTRLAGIFSCYKYNNKAKRFLKLIKYGGYSDLIIDMAKSMERQFANIPISFDFLVPVPIHKKRLEKRGFNQAELLAKNLTWNYKNILIRTKNTKPQADLGKEERMGNVENAFSVIHDVEVAGKTVLLIDDVYTTGSTLENCAEVLIKAEAKKVYGLTWAQD